MIRSVLAAATLAVAAAATPAAAETTFISNWDSTNFGPNPGFVIRPSYEGWVATIGGIEIQYNNRAGQPHSGANLVELDANFNSQIDRGITSGRYLLTFWYSPRPNVAANSNGLDVLLNGSSIFAASAATQIAGGSQTNWTRYQIRFNAANASTLSFAARGRSDSLGAYIDTVSLAAVPEPATWAFMILGFGLVGGALRRRRVTARLARA